MWRMLAYFRKRRILLVVLSIIGASTDVIISPGAALEGKRNVISLAGHQTPEDRRTYLQGAQKQGYTCWMIPGQYKTAVCIKNPSSIYTDLPESAEALRLTLAKVNLRAWLPSLLCPIPLVKGEGATTHSEMIDRARCREVVEASLATQPHAEITLTASRQGRDHLTTTIRASVEDTPWLQAMETWIEWDDADYLTHCSAVYVGLASQRAKMQLLPALRILVGQKQTLSLPERDGSVSSDTRYASSAPATPASKMEHPSLKTNPAGDNWPLNTAETPITTSAAEPSAKRIESLLSLLEGADEESNAMMEPSLRMVFPLPGGRVSGGVVTFIGKVTLGAALTARFDSTNSNFVQNRGTERLPPEQRRLWDDNDSSNRCSGGNCYGFEKHTPTMPPGPDFDLCVVRVIVDDAVASIVPIDAETSADENGTSNTKTTVVIKTAVTPIYENKKRCTEHPAKEATAAAADRGAWTDDEFIWRLGARAIDTLCTRETFGPHRIHGELACRIINNDEKTAGSGEVVTEEASATPSLGGTPEPQPQLKPQPKPNEPQWDVLATSTMVEYFHTGNLGDVLSSSPWKVDVEDAHDNALDERGDEQGGTDPLFDPPPDELSVSLYSKSDPKTTLAVVTVPRWLSDGDVWEAAFNACWKTFRPSEGFMVNTNDCVDLVTSAVAAKRVDLYYTFSMRLMAYLERISSNFTFLGNTGANPEKVEALGAITRKGGERVGTICEVGFNAGHSSLNWLLSSHPSTNILAFDLGEHDYMKHALDFLQAVFPGRLEVILGDSRVTVPAYATAEETAGRDPRVCDVVFVDGDHSEEGAYADIVNLQALASRSGNVLAIDDFDWSSVMAAWRRYREDGGGRLEHVVQATGEYFAHSWESERGESHVQVDDVMHAFFMNHGHFSLGVGTYVLP